MICIDLGLRALKQNFLHLRFYEVKVCSAFVMHEIVSDGDSAL